MDQGPPRARRSTPGNWGGGATAWFSTAHLGQVIIPDFRAHTIADAGVCPICGGTVKVYDPVCSGTGKAPCPECLARKSAPALPQPLRRRPRSSARTAAGTGVAKAATPSAPAAGGA